MKASDIVAEEYTLVTMYLYDKAWLIKITDIAEFCELLPYSSNSQLLTEYLVSYEDARIHNILFRLKITPSEDYDPANYLGYPPEGGSGALRAISDEIDMYDLTKNEAQTFIDIANMKVVPTTDIIALYHIDRDHSLFESYQYDSRIEAMADSIFFTLHLNILDKADFFNKVGQIAKIKNTPEARLGGKAWADFQKDVYTHFIKTYGKLQGGANKRSLDAKKKRDAKVELIWKTADMIEDAISNTFPGDPWDTIGEELASLAPNLDQVEAYQLINLACKTHLGAPTLNDLLDMMRSDYVRDGGNINESIEDPSGVILVIDQVYDACWLVEQTYLNKLIKIIDEDEATIMHDDLAVPFKNTVILKITEKLNLPGCFAEIPYENHRLLTNIVIRPLTKYALGTLQDIGNMTMLTRHEIDLADEQLQDLQHFNDYED